MTMRPGHDNGLSEQTQRWLEHASLDDRKRLGQFMTPAPLRERLLDSCDLFPGMRVLDPGVGTGEFLRSVLDREPNAEVFGWDVDPTVLSVASALVPEAQLDQRSALDPYLGEPFDLVIGNPPYFQFKASREVRTYFARVISGRVNVFALFFQAGMEALRTGGQLAYVIPPSMNNGAYFERLREYIVQSSAVEFLRVVPDQTLFDSAQTPVQLIVLRYGALDTGHHVYTRHSTTNGFRRTIFSEDPKEIHASFEGRHTLYELGFEAVTGTIVWNQHRPSLRHTPSDSSVPLIWAHNIRDQLRLIPDHKRPQFIETNRPTLTGPAIVTNRIVGSVGSAELRCALVPHGMEFVGENHVNVIRAHGRFIPSVDWHQLLTALQLPSTAQRVRLLTGNTQISATEMTHLLPV
ncbi:MAG: N-6 DNA methylase [bacterium]|nr:N-6 DNA methylase [bacterium]